MLGWDKDGVYLDVVTPEGQLTRMHLTVREVEQRDFCPKGFER